MNETTVTAITVSFIDSTTKKSVGTGNIRVDFKYSGMDLIANIPSGYHFLQDPTKITVDATTKQIEVASHNSVPTNIALADRSTMMVYIDYRTEKNGAVRAITFNNLADAKVDGNNTIISKATIDQKLLNSSVYYTSPSYGVDSKYLEYIFYQPDNGSASPVGLRNITPLELTKISDDTLTEKTINLQFGNSGGSAKVSVADLTIKDGTVTLTGATLAKALNAQAERDKKDYLTYKVEKFPSSISFSIYGVKDNDPVTIESTELKEAKIYAVLSEDTPVNLTVQASNPNSELFKLNNLTLKDLGLSASSSNDYGIINDTTTKVKNYFTTNFDKLNYGRCDFGTNVFAVDLVKNSHPTWNENTALSGTVWVTLKEDPQKLYEQEYTLVFENSSKTGEIVDRDTRKWKDFFKGTVGTELTEGLMTADVLPTGWKVSAIQQAGSTEKKKKETSEVSEAASIDKNGNNLALSVFSSKEIKVYVYGGKMPSSNGGGSTDKEEPTTPDTPDTPMNPEQPTIPSQGRSVMYRVYNPQTHEHLYTQDAGERDKLLASGWNDEGHGWTAPAISSYKVYRVFNPNSGEHHYTMDQNEYDTLISYGWTGEGTAFFSANDVDNKVTLYRLYHPNAPESAKHHYTMDEKERNDMIADGWIPEGTAWYGLPN